ncbi:MAG: class 1 fructose-bisphosphatase [Bacteroidota bacterium]
MKKQPPLIPPDVALSLTQFFKEEQQQLSDLPPALLPILKAIISAGKTINEVVRKLALTGLLGTRGTYNASGDEQQKLDLLAHEAFVHTLAATGEVAAVISEEEADIIVMPNHDGNYVVAIDPLDGSPNIDVNASIGTIFSVYQRRSSQPTPMQAADVLQAGQHQLAAGYILYGTATMLVYTVGNGVHGFTYDPAADDFLLAYQAMKMPQDGKSYAVNDGYFDVFPSYVQRYIQQCRQQGYAARYMGALVADFHRHLLQGGIYLYPPTQKNPEGKLRLTLECNALAFIAKQAGGLASNGHQAILTIQPQTIHQRVPLYIGSQNMVESLLAIID